MNKYFYICVNATVCVCNPGCSSRLRVNAIRQGGKWARYWVPAQLLAGSPPSPSEAGPSQTWVGGLAACSHWISFLFSIGDIVSKSGAIRWGRAKSFPFLIMQVGCELQIFN